MLKAVAQRMGESKATVPHFYVSVRDRHDPGAGAPEGAERGARRLGREGGGERPHRARVRPGARRCTRRPTAPTSTAGTSTTPTPTSGSPSRSTTASSCRSSATPTRRAFATIAAEARDLAERARAGKLRQSEIEGGTFTVSNMGMLGRLGVRGHHQPARVDHPGGVEHDRAPGRPRRRRRRWARSCRSRSRATTARAPEPTAPGCSRPSSATSKPRPCCSHDHPTRRTLDLMQLTDVMATQVVSVTPETEHRRRRPPHGRGGHRRGDRARRRRAPVRRDHRARPDPVRARRHRPGDAGRAAHDPARAHRRDPTPRSPRRWRSWSTATSATSRS